MIQSLLAKIMNTVFIILDIRERYNFGGQYIVVYKEEQ